MPKLREALKQTSGVDVGGNEFTLQETDIQPYIDNPEMSQMEADVTQARYGGSSIQDEQPGGPPPGMPAAKGPVDFSRRKDFENAVFKQLATDTMPDGNPFNFNTTASLNKISKSDLPELFSTVFQNEVTWQDRHLLDDEQKKYWMSEVKRYRAHLSTALEGERATAIDGYNQMMNQFDNAAKEVEVARKRKRQSIKDVQEVKSKIAKRESDKEEASHKNMKRRTELYTQEVKIIEDYMAKEATGVIKPEEEVAIMANLQAVRDERKAIEAKLKPGQVPKPKSAPTLVSDEGKGESPTVVRKKVPKTGKTVVKTGTVKSGPNKGRKKIMYEDGSTAYADEIK